MELDKDDIIKFYELLSRYDKVSTNIGVVGNKEDFIKRIKSIYNKINENHNCRLIVNDDKTKCIMVIGDMEMTYINIKQLSDMKGYKFRKFI